MDDGDLLAGESGPIRVLEYAGDVELLANEGVGIVGDCGDGGGLEGADVDSYTGYRLCIVLIYNVIYGVSVTPVRAFTPTKLIIPCRVRVGASRLRDLAARVLPVKVNEFRGERRAVHFFEVSRKGELLVDGGVSITGSDGK